MKSVATAIFGETVVNTVVSGVKSVGKDNTQSCTARCGHGIHCVEQSNADVQGSTGGDQQVRQDGPGLSFAD